MSRILLVPALLRHWFSRQRTALVHQLADDVARRCRRTLWQRTCHETAMMSIPEIRGYVRAQASGLVEFEADAALANHDATGSLRGQIVDAALEQLIAMMIRDALSEQPACEMQMIAA
jgi:hypothetical protein